MERLFVYLTDLSGGAAYAIIFGILVACGLGFPLPEDVPLIAAGYLVWDGTMTWTLAIAVTMTGVIIGDTILFFIGRKLGMKILDQGKVQTFLNPAKVRRTKAYFRKYGDKIVFFARFVAGFRAAAFFLAGALNMRYSKFVLLDGLAALVSVPVWIVIGYGLGHWFGSEISQMLLKMKQFKNGFTILVLSVIVIFAARAYVKYQKAKKEGKTRGARRAAVKPQLPRV